MLLEPTIEKLHEMRLGNMADAWQQQQRDVRIPLHSISRSGRIRSGFRASDQESERSDEYGGWSGGGLGLGLGFQTFLAAHG